MATKRTNDNLNITIDDLVGGGDKPAQMFEVPEISKNGQPGHFWLRILPADDVLRYLEDNEKIADDAPAAVRTQLLRDSMLNFVRRAVVTSDTDMTPLFANVPNDRLRQLLPINVFNRLVVKINEMAGLVAGDTGKDSASADTGVSPTV